MTKEYHTPIAIIGLGCIYPKSPQLSAFWRLLYHAQDGITDIPDTHWSPEDYYSEERGAPDRVYSKRGGFIDPTSFDPTEFGIPPASLEATDTSQLLGLVVAKAALADAGYGAGDHFDRDRTSVILGVTGTQELVIPLGARLGHPIWRRALADAGVPEPQSEKVVKNISKAYTQWQESSFPGLLGNVVAGRISNRLNLGGTNCVVDAACASSLSAVHTAIMELVTNKCDMAVTGGVDTLNDIFMHMCFSSTGILSPNGDVRPFSKDADGTLLGEGVGLIILKRLENAVKDQDRIYAVIKGVGTSSDGKSQSIYAPNQKGQAKALRKAYQIAQVSPLSIELLEAHGTGTRVGDKVEFEALREVYDGNDHANGQRQWCALGSVKSMLGHTKAAAGSAGLIKAALSLYHKVLPPTLKAEDADPELNIQQSPFYLNSQTRPWIASPEHPRRAGVSSFGFGGSNYHMVLEEFDHTKQTVSWDGSIEILAFSGNTYDALEKALDKFIDDFRLNRTSAYLRDATARSRKRFSVAAPYRLLMVLESVSQDFADLDRQLQNMAQQLKDTRPDDHWHSGNLYFGGPQKPGKLAFLFPGQGSQYINMGRDLICTFPQAMALIDFANEQFGRERTLSQYIFPRPVKDRKALQELETRLRSTDIAQPAIGAVSIGMMLILDYFGITADATCGHSYGELPALLAAGRFDQASFMRLSIARGALMAAAGSASGQDSGAMLAVKAPLEEIDALIAQSGLTDVILANRNSPVQGVLSGPTEDILKAEKLCKAQKFRAIKLPVAAAFHSKMVAEAQQPFSDLLDEISFSASTIPVYSNSSAEPYPDAPEQARTLLAGQILSPVRFVEQIRNLYDYGVDTFVEVGPKTVLSGLVKAIQKGQRFYSVAVDGSGGKKFGVADLARAISHIASLGHKVDIDRWGKADRPPIPDRKQKMSVLLSGANYRPPKAKKNNAPASVNDRITAAPNTVSAHNIKDNSNAMTKNPTPSPTSDNLNPHGRGEAANGHRETGPVGKDRIKTVIPSGASPPPNGQHLPYALQTIQETLKSMQELQRQTTEAHKLFLQTQTQASQTLQQMLAHTQSLMGVAPAPQMVTRADATSGTDEADSPLYTSPSLAENQLKSQTGATAPGESRTDQPDPSSQAPKPVVEPDLLARPLSTPAPAEAGNDLKPEIIEKHLLAVVGELTGYPEETLALDMQIEADLGIDSIKRVEILSTLEERLPHLTPIAPETMGSIQTLRQIVEYLANAGDHTSTAPPFGGQSEVAPDSASIKDTGNGNIEKTLLSVVSELTGYPTETLNLDMEIEADLGIDSIKRVEILSTVEEQMPALPPVSPEVMGSLKTLRQIAAYLTTDAQNAPSVQQSPNPAGNHTPDALPDYNSISQPSAAESDPTPPERYDITLKQSAFTPGPESNLDPNRKVLITDNHTPLVGALEKALAAKGLTSERILWQTPLSSGEQSGRHDQYCGLILIPEPEWGQTLSDNWFLKQGFALTRQLSSDLLVASENGGAFLASITYLDGGFGFKGEGLQSPVQGGLAGLIKTAHAEWPTVTCRAFDLAPEWKEMEALATQIVRELVASDPTSSVEIGFDPVLDKDMRWISALQKNALKVDDGTAPNLSEGDVVVVTGGGRGVTASAALALASRAKPTLVIMGRTPQPTDEPEWLAGVTGEAAIKKAIVKNEFKNGKATPKEIATLYSRYMGNRELTQSLSQLDNHCQALAYFSVDVRQAEAVKSILNTVRSEYGEIKAIIHGAGVIEDKHIRDKSRDQFNRVFDTKIQGLHALLEATTSDPLQYLILFSSVTARMGNTGQADYAMANEVLNKVAQQLARKRPDCRVLSINWGPWDGGMVGSSLKNEFKRRNIDLLALQAGAEAMVREMVNPSPPPGGAEVVIGAAFSPAQHQTVTVKKPQKRADQERQAAFSTTFSRKISLADYPILDDHRLGGKPVVPFALMTEWFAHGALHANPGLQLIGLDNMRLFKGIRLETENCLVRLLAGKTIANGKIFEVDLELRNGSKGQKEMVHTSARAILSDRLQKPPLFSMPDITHADRFPYTVEEAYEKILFHGEQLRGIIEILGLSDLIVVARIQPAPAPSTWIKEPLRSHWIADPLVLDCAFQMATIWCHEKAGVVSLPSYCAAYRQYVTRFPREEITVVLQINEVTRHKMVSDFTFLSAGQAVVATLKGYEAVMDASLFRAFKTQNAA